MTELTLNRDLFERICDGIPSHQPKQHRAMVIGLVRCRKPRQVVLIGAESGLLAAEIGRAMLEMGEGQLAVIDTFGKDSISNSGQVLYNLGATQTGAKVTVKKGSIGDLDQWPDLVDMLIVSPAADVSCLPAARTMAVGLGATCVVVFGTCLKWQWDEWAVESRKVPGWEMLEDLTDGGLAIMIKPPPRPEPLLGPKPPALPISSQ